MGGGGGGGKEGTTGTLMGDTQPRPLPKRGVEPRGYRPTARVRTMPTRMSPTDATALRSPRALNLAVAAVVASLLAGCGGGGSEPAGRPPAGARPTLEVEDTAPTTRTAATRPALAATRPAGNPSLVTATRPAEADVAEGAIDDLPETDVRVEDTEDDAPATRPAVAEARRASEPRVADVVAIESPTEADAALAEEFAGLAAGTLRAVSEGGADAASVRQAEALMTAAARLDPDNARLARQLVELRLQVGGAASALEALDFYRRLRPDDRLAQLRYVDLSADALESADLKLSYLTRVAESGRVPDEVRSHAATLAALLLRERLEDAEADAMVRRAAELDPYNPQALRMDYERLLATGADRPARVGALARALRANVAQPATLEALAGELGAVGLVDEAGEFLEAALRAYAAAGVAPPAGLASDRAALLIVNNRPEQAMRTLPPEPPQPPAARSDWVLLQGLARRMLGAGPDQLATLVEPLDAALLGIMEPVDGQAPDLFDAASFAARVRELPDVRDKLAAALAVVDRAWFDLYVLGQPTDAGYLDAAERVLESAGASGASTMARLRGWQAWRQGDAELARERLSSVAGDDPFARLGLLLVRREAGEEVAGEALALLREYPTGVTGATTAEAFSREGLMIGDPAEAAAVAAALEADFPRRLLRLLEPGQARQFYTISAEPLKVSHQPGEPILATLAIRNGGPDPITIGPGGLVGPQVRLDATVGGMIESQPIPASNYVPLSGRTRLERGERLEQEVRVDGPQLAALLAGQPQLQLKVTPSAVTNPIARPVPNPQDPDGAPVVGYGVGPAGQAVEFGRIAARTALPLDLADPGLAQQREARLSDLRDAQDPLRRLRAAQATATELRLVLREIAALRESGAGADRVQPWQQLGGRLRDTLRRAAVSSELGGDSAATGAYLRYVAASVAPTEDRLPLLRPLLNAGGIGPRMLGVLAVSNLVADREAAIAAVAPLGESDPDPTVRRYAAAVAEYLRSRPAEAPADDGTAVE